MRNHIIEADAGGEKKNNRWAIFTGARGEAGTWEGPSGEIFAGLARGKRARSWELEEEKGGLMSKRTQ